jgi:hypothetical protein
MTIRIGGEEEEILDHQEVEASRIQVSGKAIATISTIIMTNFSTLA